MENQDKNNQAKQLEYLLNELQMTSKEKEKSKKPFSGTERVRKVDILNLPPRKEIHQKKGWIKPKFSRPLVRFLLVCTVLVLIFAGVYYYWGSDIFNIINQL